MGKLPVRFGDRVDFCSAAGALEPAIVLAVSDPSDPITPATLAVARGAGFEIIPAVPHSYHAGNGPRYQPTPDSPRV